MPCLCRTSWPRSLKIKEFTVAALSLLCSGAFCPSAASETPVRVAIVGLVHGHVKGLLRALPNHNAAALVAIVEPDTALAKKYADSYRLESKLFYTDLDRMFKEQHPDAVLVYTTIQDHRKVIEAAARYKVSSMVEKPLSTTLEDALAIRAAAQKSGVQVLVNYETTWYSSNHEVFRQIAKGDLGEVRKVVVHDGHEGPKEIGVGPEWLPWLTDPVKNGAGSLFDFGCYGADLLTVMMHGEAPLSVTAVVQTDKPDIYPLVDDDATLILRYRKTQAVLMPSWNWSFARKDMEVYGTSGYAITVGADRLRVRYRGEKGESSKDAPALPQAESSSLDYLAAVLHGQTKASGDLSALDTNVVVMQILDAGRRSAKTGRTIALTSLAR